MSRTVDERVVSMQFDNKQFEQNVQTSINTMDKLKESLKFTGATKGLENIDDASKKINMSPLGTAVEQIGVKFNALQVMAVTALSNITNSAVNAGKRLVSAFTIDPIKTGLQEYETQINAVQTILANTESKGTTLDQVNTALDELNTYADKTIYNFTEMTRNIGTFTAAGVDLDTSVNAIQGIANLAAVSGSTSQQASTAMYQLSQALSSGTVKLMDWNSVVNAGMGGQVFQDALKETARNAGINIDGMIEKYGSFRETLQTGWLSADVLTETLSHFTMAAEEGSEQWNEFKKSLMDDGYTEEQALAILKLSNTATNAATKVKTFTQLMDTLKESAQSGWTQTWEILIGDFEEAKALWTNVSDVIGGIIGRSAEARNSLLQGWKDLGGRQMVIDSISNAFTGLMNILKPIGEAFREVFPATTSQQLLTATERIKGLTEKFKAFTENSKNIEKIKSAFKGLFSIISIVITIAKELVSGILTLASNLGDLLKGVLNITGSFGDWVSGVRDAVNETGFFSTVIGGLVTAIQKVIDVLKVVTGFLKEKIVAPGFQGFLTLMQGIWKVMSWIGEKIVAIGRAIGGALADAFTGGHIDNIIDIFSSGVFAAILLKLKSIVGGLKDFSESAGDFLENIKGIFEGVTGCLEGMQKKLQAEALSKIATAIAILAASLLVLSLINPDRMDDAIMGITMLFTELLASMAVFNKIGGVKDGVIKTISMMIAMSISVLMLAGALKIISTIDTQGMITGVLGIAAVMAILVAAIKSLQSSDPKSAVKGAGQMFVMAMSLTMLAGALKILSTMTWQEMLIGITAMVVTLGALVGAVKILEKGEIKAAGAGQMFVMAMSLTMLAGALKILATMSWQEMAIGLTAMIVTLGALVGAVKILEQGDFKASGAGQMLVMAVSLTILAGALKILAGMSWEQLAIGLAALGSSLALLAFGLHAMNGTLAGSGALMVASVALLMLASSLVKMGGMSWDQLGVSLVALGGSLAILALGLCAMTGTLAGSGALIVAAAAIAILTPSLLLLGSMSWSSLGIGLLAIAGAFTILGVAGALLGPLVPVILGLSGAMALLGIGVLALGAGLIMAATGLTALAAAFSASGTIIVSGITAILTGIIGLIPALAVAIGQGIIAICNVIAGAAGSICAAIAAIIVAVSNALIIATPPLVQAIFVVLDTVLQKLVEYTPKIVEAAVNLVLALLDGLATGLPKIVESAVTLIEKFLLSLGEQLPRIVDAGFKMIISFIEGITKAIADNGPVLAEKIRELFKTILKTATTILTDGIKDFKSAGKEVIRGFINGIKDKISAVGDAASEIGKKALNSIKSFLGINSPSKEFAEIGRYSDEGLIAGLKAYSGKVAATAGNVGGSALDSMKKSISGMANLFGSDLDGQPTIRPVLDLSAVAAGANSINGMLDMTPSIGVMSTIGAINSAMNGRQNGGNSDVITAINDLGSKLGNARGDTYQINGVTYDDGSNIVGAIEAIVREARIERRK